MTLPLRRQTAALWLAALLVPGCEQQEATNAGAAPPPPVARPGADEVLLVVDGVRVTFGDIAEPVAWLDRLIPEYSERTKVRRVLSEYTLPLLFARREFAAERQQQLALARTVRAGCDNVAELDAGTARRPRTKKRVSHADVELPVATFLFDAERTGSVSAPIEVPRGWVLAGAFDILPGPVPVADACEALLVTFAAHDDAAFNEWLGALPTRLAAAVTYVHPDYRLAMPPWMKLP